MTARYLALAFLGACAGTGLAVITVTMLDRRSRTPRQPEHTLLRALAWRWRPVDARSLVLPGAAGAAAWVFTGWPMPAVLTGCAVYFLPGLLRGGPNHSKRLARIDAVAAWAELLHDTLSASAGLLEAIRATGPLAPDAIRPATTRLIQHLGRDPHAALRAFADEVADPIADRVVIALGFALDNPARDLAGLLGALALAAREQAAMSTRLQIAWSRTRTDVRVICGVTIGLGAGLAVFDRGFLAPYQSTIGQFALAAIGALFAGGLAWLGRLSQIPEPPRVLAAARSVPAQRSSLTNPQKHTTRAGGV